jgi:hypothetical protein
LRGGATEVFVLLGYGKASLGSLLPTFRDSVVLSNRRASHPLTRPSVAVGGGGGGRPLELFSETEMKRY